MTTRILELVLANVLMLVLGCGLLPFLHLARTRRELLTRAPLGYAVGLAATGILGADLAVAYVPVGRILLPVAGGGLAVPRPAPRPRRRPAAQGADLDSFRHSRCSQRRSSSPCRWRGCSRSSRSPSGTAGRSGRPGRGRSTSSAIRPHRCSPTRSTRRFSIRCSCPALEAIDFRFMGAFDGTLVHLQLLGLADRIRRWRVDAAQRHGEADPARGDAAGARRHADVREPAADELRRHPARDVHRAGGRRPRELAAHRRRGDAARGGALPRRRRAHEERGRDVRADGDRGGDWSSRAAASAGRSCSPRALSSSPTFRGGSGSQVEHVKIADYSLSNLFNPRYLADHADRVAPSAHELLRQIWAMGSWSYLDRAGARRARRRRDPWAVPPRLLRGRLARALVRGPDRDLLDLDQHPGRQPLRTRPTGRSTAWC